jgi:hypothetical protein
MTDQEAARRYHWFCTIGYRTPFLNDPVVITDDASPEYIDQLVERGMRKWPKREIQMQEPMLPRCA